LLQKQLLGDGAEIEKAFESNMASCRTFAFDHMGINKAVESARKAQAQRLVARSIGVLD
jgi:hypothetical protein